MIKSWPYNPNAQGKVERSHRVLRKKIYYDMSKMKKNGVNWVKNSPMYMKCLNNDKREEIGWENSFQVYYGRENNEILRPSLLSNEEIDICRVQPGKKRDYNYFVKKTNKKSKGKRCKYQNVLTRDQSKGMKN